ncbi:MAG TPA: S8 family serine peptidase [Myxococcota bacterium]
MSLSSLSLAMALAASAATSTPPTAPTVGAPTAPVDIDEVVEIDDGGARRRIERIDADTVRYIDVATGRRTIAGRSRTALVQVAAHDELGAVMARHGLGLVRAAMPSIGLYVVEDRARSDGVLLTERLQATHDPALRLVFPNLAFAHTTHASAADAGMAVPPDDTRYAAQWFLEEIGIEAAWQREAGDPDVVVAVVDNGCDVAHPDLVDKLEPGHDVVSDDDDPSHVSNAEGNNHGTACAGLIAASTDNDRDIAGACPLCRLRCTRLLPAGRELVPLDADVRAFDLAFEDDVDVINNSWGFIDAIPVPAALAAAIEHVHDNGRGGLGAVVVFASGNDNREVGDDELLAVRGVIGVGAVNNLGELTQFSNRGRSVDIVAPTGTVATDVSGPGGDSDGDVTFRFGGTSSAAPLIAGIAGLLLAHDPTLTADEVAGVLEATAKQSIFATPDADGHDVAYGWGLVQPAAALAALDDDGLPAPDDDDDVALGGGGCGCTASTSPATVLWSLLVACAALRRRQR